MIDVRRFGELGRFHNDWLDARHHFSFGNYHDAARMGVGALRVWNDDEIAAGRGFDPHPHRDMEIITYVRQGAITHRDSLGNEGRTAAGDVQVMHAGTGIVHAEYNREPHATRLFQIWIAPDRLGVQPGWGARQFPRSGDGLSVLASGRAADARSDALTLYADAAVFAGTLKAGGTVRHSLPKGRAAYIVPATGVISLNGVQVSTRDGAAVVDEPEIEITAAEAAELVVVEVRA